MNLHTQLSRFFGKLSTLQSKFLISSLILGIVLIGPGPLSFESCMLVDAFLPTSH